MVRSIIVSILRRLVFAQDTRVVIDDFEVPESSENIFISVIIPSKHDSIFCFQNLLGSSQNID